MSLLFLNTIFYIDNNIISTIIEIRPAFDTDDDSYYRFFLLFIDRVYEPVHVFSGEQIRSSHGPSIIGILILIISTFLLQFSPGAPVKKPTLQHGYLVFLTLLGLFGIIIFIWILITFFVYMSLKIDDFRIHIAPPVSPKNLGLTAYSNFIIGISIRLIISFVLGIFLIFQSPSPFIIFNVILASLLFICWIISTQYGLHNAIIYSKKDFYKNNIYYSNSTSREKLLSNYDKLKNIPNWPVGTGQIAEIIISSLLPIISVLLRFYALI